MNISLHDSLNHCCTCRSGNTETRFYLFLHCSISFDERLALLSSFRSIDATIRQQSNANLTVLLFTGLEKLGFSVHKSLSS